MESLAPTILIGGGGTVDQSMEFLLGMGMARGLVGLAGTDAHDEVVKADRLSPTKRYEPGVGVELGAGAWIFIAIYLAHRIGRPPSPIDGRAAPGSAT